ncbi:MAG TPA: hypothetical protein ACFYEK_06175 [Candidatus Wunengus sp. YC60]|uniref:hypothetical protein n=1 Tax=Candidatus Wunengus sp. YC60 TaxID=3367697 RepID=UPI004029CFAB
MINQQAKGNVEIEPSENGSYIIKSTSQESIPVSDLKIQPVMNASRSKQQLFTANNIDETMIIAREQLEKIIGLV